MIVALVVSVAVNAWMALGLTFRRRGVLVGEWVTDEEIWAAPRHGDRDHARAVTWLERQPVLIGLAAQGHLGTVRSMLAAGRSWDEIGVAIGWDPGTARRWFEMSEGSP